MNISTYSATKKDKIALTVFILVSQLLALFAMYQIQQGNLNSVAAQTFLDVLNMDKLVILMLISTFIIKVIKMMLKLTFVTINGIFKVLIPQTA